MYIGWTEERKLEVEERDYIYLIPETIQEPDRVHLQDRVDRTRACVQVPVDVLGEERDDVHQRVRARHTLARRRTARRHRRHQVNSRVLVAPGVALRGIGTRCLVRGEALGNPGGDDLGGLCLKPAGDECTEDVGSSLAARRAFCGEPTRADGCRGGGE